MDSAAWYRQPSVGGGGARRHRYRAFLAGARAPLTTLRAARPAPIPNRRGATSYNDLRWVGSTAAGPDGPRRGSCPGVPRRVVWVTGNRPRYAAVLLADAASPRSGSARWDSRRVRQPDGCLVVRLRSAISVEFPLRSPSSGRLVRAFRSPGERSLTITRTRSSVTWPTSTRSGGESFPDEEKS